MYVRVSVIGVAVLLGVLIVLGGCAARDSKLLPDARSQYEFALSRYQQGKYDDAVLDFQKVLFNYPGVSFIDSAQYWFAMSYYGREDYHLAAAEFRRLVTNFASSDLADDAQYMIGKCDYEAAPGNIGLDQTDTRDAIKELQAFIDDFPYSDRRKEGEALLLEAKEKMVDKQFKTAQQYMKLGAPRAARVYLEEIVTDHQYSKVVPEALYMLAQVDAKAHQYADARDKLNNLLSAYPDSKVVGKATKMKREMEEKIAKQAESESPAVSDTSQGDE